MLDAILIIAITVLPTMFEEHKKMEADKTKQEQSKTIEKGE